jgi:hypothetical protein
MKDTDFELIMAYADGETSPEETARAEALLAEQPQAKAVLARLRAVDHQIKTSLDTILDEPVPQRLIHASATDAPAPRVLGLLRFPKTRPLAPTQWALAASLVLALGFVLSRGTSEPGAQTLQQFVDQTLDQTPSEQLRTDSKHGWQIMPLASYNTADNRLCRHYAGRIDGNTLSGLACRTDNSEWQTLVSEIQVITDGFQPASGPDGAVAEALKDLQTSEPLTAEQEAVRLHGFNK